MVNIERKAKQVFRSFQASFGGLMRARLVSERQLRTKKIRNIKATIKAIDVALHKPGSKIALRRRGGVRNPMVQLMDQEVSDLSASIYNRKRTVARLLAVLTHPFI